MSVERWSTRFSDIDWVGQDGQEVSVFAIPSRSTLALIFKVTEEGETVPLLEVADDGASLLLVPRQSEESVGWRAVGRVLVVLVLDPGRDLLVAHGGDLDLLVLSLPGQDHHPIVTVVIVIVGKVVVPDPVTLEYHPLRLLSISNCCGGVKESPDL